MNLHDAKTNMIKQQLRTIGVIDPTIIHLFQEVDRAAFVSPEHQDLAYADMMLPMGKDQVMLSPADQARMLQALKIKPHESVLEVGTGNGFLTALLAKLAAEVISVELQAALSTEAAGHLQRLHINNVKLQTGNAANGWKLDAPVDVVIITGSLPFVPISFKACLKEQGRILAIIGEQPGAMRVSLITKGHNDEYNVASLFDTNVPALEKALQPERFIF